MRRVGAVCLVLLTALAGAGAMLRARHPSPAEVSCARIAATWRGAAPRPASRVASSWDPPAVRDFPPHEAGARSPVERACAVAAGRRLFEARFTRVEGAGRPNATGDSKPTLRPTPNDLGFTRVSGPDASSCAGCHNQPAIGGSGDFAVNVFVGAQFKDPPTRSIARDLTNERNTIGLFGAGAVEQAAREMTRELFALRDSGLSRASALQQPVRVELRGKSVDFGTLLAYPDGSYGADSVIGVDRDLVVKAFGAKGVGVSIREFTIAALNQHHGIQPIERFGWERTGRRDFDADGVFDEFTVGQLTALVLFQASLPPPRVRPSGSRALDSTLAAGERRFREAGCAGCHRPTLPLDDSLFREPNPYNRPGTLTPEDVGTEVPLPLPVADARAGVFRGTDGRLYLAAFTDLKRHRICDNRDRFLCNEVLRQDNVPVDQFLTAKLWDLGSSAPYCHRGDCTTVSEAILHHAGEATASRHAFLRLPDRAKEELIAFLLSHHAPGEDAAE
jgi:cytochrome c peroxidase